jgi:hypothetical protein
MGLKRGQNGKGSGVQRGAPCAEHQVSLKRPDGYYMVDNEMVTVFAPLVGPFAFGVYSLLKQRSFLKEEKDRAISLAGIALLMGMSKESAGAAVRTLRQYGLVEQYSSTASNTPPRYEVVHAKDALALRPEYRTQADAILQGAKAKCRPQGGLVGDAQKEPQNPQLRAKSRTRVTTHRGRDVGRTAGEIQDAAGRNVGRSQAKCRTPNKEEGSKGSKNKDKEQPTLPSLGGRAERRSVLDAARGRRGDHGKDTDLEAGDEEQTMQSGADDDAQGEFPDTGAKGGGGFVEAQAPAHRAARVSAGPGVGEYATHPESEQLRGGGRSQAGVRQNERSTGLTPVRETLVGILLDLKKRPTVEERPVVAIETEMGLDDAIEIFGGEGGEEAEVETVSGHPLHDGPRDPRKNVRWFLEDLHDQFARQFGMPQGVVKTRGAGWEDPLSAWQRCFEHVSIGDVEAAEGSDAGLVVTLLTPRPKDLADGLVKYKAKVQMAMKKAFGREVQLVPRSEAA